MSASYLMTEDEARSFAADWIEAWNSHDLDRIMTHYAEDLVLISPIAAQFAERSCGHGQGQGFVARIFPERIERVSSAEIRSD